MAWKEATGAPLVDGRGLSRPRTEGMVSLVVLALGVAMLVCVALGSGAAEGAAAAPSVLATGKTTVDWERQVHQLQQQVASLKVHEAKAVVAEKRMATKLASHLRHDLGHKLKSDVHDEVARLLHGAGSAASLSGDGDVDVDTDIVTPRRHAKKQRHVEAAVVKPMELTQTPPGRLRKKPATVKAVVTQVKALHKAANKLAPKAAAKTKATAVQAKSNAAMAKAAKELVKARKMMKQFQTHPKAMLKSMHLQHGPSAAKKAKMLRAQKELLKARRLLANLHRKGAANVDEDDETTSQYSGKDNTGLAAEQAMKPKTGCTPMNKWSISFC